MDTRHRRFRARLAGILALALLLSAAPLSVAAPGDLDPSFDGDGKVTSDLGGSDSGSDLIRDSTGRILVAVDSGPDFTIARYNPDGSLDHAFGSSGVVTTDFAGGLDHVFAVEVDGIGRILGAGSADGDPAIARYNSDGSLDTTFGSGGKVTTSLPGTNCWTELVLDGDGRILVCGSTAKSNGFDFAVGRYNPDGSLDTTFDSDGIAITSFGDTYAYAHSLELDGVGRIVVAGQAYNNRGAHYDFALARYLDDGSLDTAFDGDGRVITNSLGDARAYAVVIDGTGRIIAAGVSWIPSTGTLRDFALARYNPDGTLDATFGADGRVTTDFAGDNNAGSDLALDAADHIVVAGYATTPTGEDFARARHDSHGMLDATFGSGGKVTTDLLAVSDRAKSVMLDETGRIVLAGYGGTGYPDWDVSLARYQGDVVTPPSRAMYLPLVWR